MNTPTGVQQDDLLFVAVAITSNAATITTPSGWTINSSNSLNSQNLYTYRRVATASEPASYTWTYSVAITASAWEGAYIGVNTASPIDANGSGSGQVNTLTHSTSSFTANTAGDQILAAYSVNALVTMSTPTGMSAQTTLSSNGTNPVTLAVFDGFQTTAGTVSSKASTSSALATDANNAFAFKPAGTNIVTLGSATTTLGSIASPTLRSVSIPTSAATFATGDRLVFELSVPNDAANCGVRLSYDEATVPSKLTVATIVPEGVLGLLLLAPALPFAARWWKRRRP